MPFAHRLGCKWSLLIQQTSWYIDSHLYTFSLVHSVVCKWNSFIVALCSPPIIILPNICFLYPWVFLVFLQCADKQKDNSKQFSSLIICQVLGASGGFSRLYPIRTISWTCTGAGSASQTPAVCAMTSITQCNFSSSNCLAPIWNLAALLGESWLYPDEIFHLNKFVIGVIDKYEISNF